MEITLTVDLTLANWGDYTFYQASTRSQGILLAIPFILNEEMKGYLLYSNTQSYAMSEKELFKFGIDAIVYANVSGMIGKLSPLPYKLVDKDHVLDCIKSIVSKNATVNLGSSLYL